MLYMHIVGLKEHLLMIQNHKNWKTSISLRVKATKVFAKDIGGIEVSAIIIFLIMLPHNHQSHFDIWLPHSYFPLIALFYLLLNNHLIFLCICLPLFMMRQCDFKDTCPWHWRKMEQNSTLNTVKNYLFQKR